MPEPEPSPDSPPPRTTGGNWRWEPPSPAALEALLPGYTVERLLGRGGMGAVYKGLQASLERPVAIKILPSGIEREDPTYAERFRNEAKVMARLLHPAVVAVFDFGQTADGQLYFVMEYVDGTDIHGLIAAQGRLPADHALAITAHVCDALAAAHGLGIVHRDIKPSNVLINQLGQVKVADFGLAKVEEPGQHGLTRTGYALGTPDFVAPEALVLGASVDGRADLYAVGVMLYQMLTGDLPKGAWKAPSEKVPGLDPRFDAIVNRAMQGEPADRYQSAAELRRDLDVILTVPLVQADAPATAALPQQAMAGVAGKRSIAAKVPPPAQGRSGGRTPRQARNTAPVKPPGKDGTAAKGKKAWVLAVGIGAVVLVFAGIYFAFTASQEKRTADDSKALPNAFAIAETPAKEKAPPPNPGPVTSPPSAAPKPAAPAPSKSAPLPDAFSASETVPAATGFGVYPAGLKVPVPAWLGKASEEGGRLEFIKTAGIPAEFDPLFDLGEAGKFDDFVAVYRAPYAWLAVRKNGDLWGRGWVSDFKKSAAFGPIRSASIIRAWNPILVDGEGRLHSFPGGAGKPTQTPGISGLKSALGRTTSTTGFLHILLGSGNETLETRNTQPDTIPPPPDFFRDAGVVGASNVSFFAAKPGEPLRGWDLKTGAPVPIQNPPTDVVEIAGGGSDYALLTSEGSVRIIHATTGIGTLGGSKPPSTLGPALRVRNGGVCFLAQRTDGTWAAWQLDSDRQTSDRSDLISRIDAYGPALDMETGAIRVPGQELARFWALAIKPKSTAPSAGDPILTTNPAPVPPPTTNPATSIVPAWLVEARQRGGKVRFFSPDPTIDLGTTDVENLEDITLVTATSLGWAVQRASGEVLGARLYPKEGDVARSPKLFGPIPALAIHRGEYFRLRHAIDDSMLVFSSSTEGPALNKITIETDLPSVAIIGKSGHSVILGPGGHILAQIPPTSASPPPPDFFKDAILFASTYGTYLAANAEGVPRIWNFQSGVPIHPTNEWSGIVEVEGATDYYILRDNIGEVRVASPSLEKTGEDVGNIPSDLPSAIAVRVGVGMAAAQSKEGTWIAWGASKELVEKTKKIGVALDVDYQFGRQEGINYMVWIEPPATATAPDLPPSTQLTTSSPVPAQPTPAPSPASPAPSDSAVAADLLVKAKTRGGRLRTVGKSRNGPFQISGPAATFDDFVQVSASHFGWAARRATGETHAGTWGGAAPEPYQPLGPYETTFLSRAAFIQMLLADGTSRNVWSDSSQLQGAKPPAADRIVAVMNHVIRFEPDGKQHWLYGSASPEKPDFLAGGPLVTGTYDSFIRHRRGEPVASWVPKSGTEFTFPEDTRDTVEMDGGQDHVILLDARGKVQVWREDGKPLEAEHALRAGLPSDLDTFVAVRAGKGMSAAQRADGTWVAWGTDATLAKEIGGLGKALDLDLFHDGEASFALWIEPSEDATRLTEAVRLPEDVAKRLAEIEAQFQAAYDRDVAPGFDAAVTDLDTKYRAAVQRALDAAIAAGNLDESVKLRAEIQRLDAREPLPETDPGDLPETLRKLRATYRDTHGKLEADRAAKAKPYHDRYDQLLDAYQKELTQQQRIDDALKVKARREVARPGGPAPSAAAGPSAAAPTLAGAPPPAAPPSLGAAPVDPLDPGRDLSKLPPWLQQAAKEGGKLRIWGTIKGTPIDEKEVLKDLRANDFTQVMTGESGLIFGMRQNGKGYHLAIDAQDPILNPVESGKIQSIDRRGGVWLADDFSWTNGRRSGNELKLGKDPIILGGGTGVLLIRLASNDWGATGYNWNNPADPSIQATMRAIGEQLKADEASVVATTVNSVHWITKDNRLRCNSINLRPGSSRELPVKTQPKEPIVELFSTSGPFGNWAARGMSGSVYSESTGGFDTPIPDLSPAVAMRYSNNALVIRAPDGTWRASSTDQKLTDFIPTVGPAIDLDFYNNSSAETRIVLWIEADSSLKPR